MANEDNWRGDILARDSLQARTVVSYLADLLYDDLYAAERERRFFEDGGAFAQRIKDAAKARVGMCVKHPAYPLNAAVMGEA